MCIGHSIIARFYAPLAAGIYLWATTPSVAKVDRVTVNANLLFVGVGIELPTPEWLTTYAFLIPLALGSLLVVYALRADFAAFFPSDLEMHVHFDRSGIYAAVEQFSATEREALKLSSANWDPQQDKYRNEVANALIAAYRAANPTRDVSLEDVKDNLYGEGRTTFEVHRQSFRKYGLGGAGGELTIKVDIANENLQPYVASFERKPSGQGDELVLGVASVGQKTCN